MKFRTSPVSRYNFKRANFIELYDDLYHIDWTYISSFSNANDATLYMYNELDRVFSRNVPRTTPLNKSYPPWFNRRIIRDIKQKSRLWRTYRETGDDNAHRDFKSLRRKIKQELDVAHKDYLINIELQIKSNPNRFWSHINNMRDATSNPSVMTQDNVYLNDPQQILNGFASVFQSSFTTSINFSVEACYVLSS